MIEVECIVLINSRQSIKVKSLETGVVNWVDWRKVKDKYFFKDKNFGDCVRLVMCEIEAFEKELL